MRGNIFRRATPGQAELLRLRPWRISYANISGFHSAAVLEKTAERINACRGYRAGGVAANAARATFRVRLETGRTVTSLRETCSAPLMRGSFFTLMRNGSTVISR